MRFTRDALNHQTTISYNDSFSDGNNSRNTFGYPTTLTDADGFSSFVQYHFDLGVKTRTQGPPPAGQSQGAIQTFEYDGALRLSRVRSENNGAYTRWIYHASQTAVQSFTTIRDLSTEAYSVQVFDGAGRVRATATDHPGSTGGYAGQYFAYDVMGRRVQQSNPTEMTGGWVAYGDDLTGWYWSYQAYDWQGRPTVTTNQDTTTKTASYGGCGCAGGEVVTLTDEGTTLTDGTIKKRQQKIYSDVLGRQWKTEILNWDGAGPNGTGGSVYSTTVSVFNSRDQVTHVRQYAGAAPAEASSTNPNASCPTGTCQETVMNFDGYARLQSKHVPEQNAGAATVYAYNADDTIQSVTDARGASATYTYNPRHFVTGIAYNAPSGITPTSNVLFDYDAAGNRTSMTDGLGSQNYSFDSLSRLVSETRTLTGIGIFTFSYEYNFAGALKKITDSVGTAIDYHFDQAGRLATVTGSGNLVAGISQYAPLLQYRAWGALKNLTYGNGISLNFTYNAAMRATRYELLNGQSAGWGGVITVRSDFQLYPDGRAKFASDSLSPEFDRAYGFDHAGRLQEASSATQARDFVNGQNSGVADGPYNQGYGYNAFGNLTARHNRFWSGFQGFYHNYTNNRIQNHMSWTYDADGRELTDEYRSKTYDAAGRQVSVVDSSISANGFTATITQSYDGNGEPIKRVEQKTGQPASTTYYLQSSALGGKVIMELDAAGQKIKGYVYANGNLLAEQSSQVFWVHRNPVTRSLITSSAAGFYVSQQEFDPFGADVGFTDPYQQYETVDYDQMHGGKGMYVDGGNPFDPSGGCSLDGLPWDCADVARRLDSGSADLDLMIGGRRTTVPVRSYGLGILEVWIPGQRIDRDHPDDDDDERVVVHRDETHGRWVSFSLDYAANGDRRFAHGARPQNPAAVLDEGGKFHLNRAFGDASTAIARPSRGRNPCRDFLMQGRTPEEVNAIFKNFWNSATYDPRLADPASTRNSNQGMAASVRVGPSFFINKEPVYNWSPVNNMYLERDTNLTPRQYRALIILHEFAHALGRIPRDGPNFDPTGQQSLKNTQTLFEKCARQLEALPLD